MKLFNEGHREETVCSEPWQHWGGRGRPGALEAERRAIEGATVRAEVEVRRATWPARVAPARREWEGGDQAVEEHECQMTPASAWGPGAEARE